MRTVNTIHVNATIDRTFAVAAEVERWPDFLRHYRYVRRLPDGLVAMSAYRFFGPLPWPTWWTSEMETIPERYLVRYRHVRGITKGMKVEWRMMARGSGVDVEIVHEWTGPTWPAIGQFAAHRVIGPVFVYHIASRTLAGVKRRAETP